MRIVVLDYPETVARCDAWKRLSHLGSVDRYRNSTLPEVLERARTADVLVTWRFPFRRDILDYITRPRLIFVPQSSVETLVERPIADQLGIMVRGFIDEPSDPCLSVEEIAETLEVSE